MAFVMVGGNIISFQTEGLFGSTQNQMPEQISNIINELPQSSGEFSTTYEPEIDTYTLQVQENRTVTADIPDAGRSSTEFLDYRIENTVIRNADKICIRKNSNNISISSGPCHTGNLSTFCANGRCINNNCQPDKGETCANSGGDCSCPADSTSPGASNTCKPDYRAENFINATGAGDSDLDATQPIGCVENKYIGAQSKGDRCEYDFECDSGKCNDPHHSAPSGVTQKRCCPGGESFNGTGCEDDDRYHLVFVPARYSSQSQFSNDATQAFNYFVPKSPFNKCSTPSNKIKKTELDVSQCNIQNCDISPGRNQCYTKMRQCANNQLGTGNWNKLVGIAKGDGPTITLPSGATGTLCGRAKNIPSDISVSYSACGTDTVSHEAGHTLGLYHIHGGEGDPGGTVCDLPGSQPNEDDGKCKGTPLSEREDFIMSYSDTRQEFGPAGSNHMETTQFSSYLGGC